MLAHTAENKALLHRENDNNLQIISLINLLGSVNLSVTPQSNDPLMPLNEVKPGLTVQNDEIHIEDADKPLLSYSEECQKTVGISKKFFKYFSTNPNLIQFFLERQQLPDQNEILSAGLQALNLQQPGKPENNNQLHQNGRINSPQKSVVQGNDLTGTPKATNSPINIEMDTHLDEKPVPGFTPNTQQKLLKPGTVAREIAGIRQEGITTQQNNINDGKAVPPAMHNNRNSPQPVQLAARMAPVIQQAMPNNQGTTTLRIKLKPEHLGEVTVRLVYNQGNLQAHFVAASAHTRELLEQSMVQLKENLAQLNINLNDASTSSGDESSRWTQGSFQQRQHNTQSNEPGFLPPEGLSPGDPLQETETSITENRGLNHLV